nr:hypothetical protein [Tanacetum cinerariifolium]
MVLKQIYVGRLSLANGLRTSRLSSLAWLIRRLSLWSLLCRVPSYTVIVPCLSKARTTDFGPEPSLDSPASPKYYSSLHKMINEPSLRSIVFPLDLNPRLPALDFRMSQLPSNAIGHRAILDYMTWKSTKSCVSEDFPTDGSDTNDVSRLCARSAKLRDISKAILVRSNLSSVWLNRRCDPVFRKKDVNTGRDVVVVEEPHELDTPILQRVKNHTTVPTIEGTPMLQEKVKFKMDQLDKFWFEFFDLKVKHEKTQEECHGRDQENKELRASNHALSDEVKSLKDRFFEVEATSARSANELVHTDSKLSEQAIAMRNLKKKLAFQESETHMYKDMVATAE